MVMANFFTRLFKLEEQKEKQSVSKIIHVNQIGSTGTESYSGYVNEEYLQTLQGSDRAKIFDKMRRSDAQNNMFLGAVKSPVLSANWNVHPAEVDEQWAQEDAELINHILFHDMDKTFNEFLEECLSFVDFGHSIFEVIDKVNINHPEFGSYNGIASLAFRSQKTIENFNLDPVTNKLASVTQYAYGDLQKLVTIPADFLLVFSLKKEGSNYEGISALRPCYGNWFRKNEYMKINAIGIEKFAIPTPLIEVPAGSESSDQYDAMISAMESYMAHEKGYLTYPAGWKIDLKSNTYDPQKVEVSIDNEDKRMTKSFILNFLELGLSGSGSHALSFDLSDFFLQGLDHVAHIVSNQINQNLIPRIIKMNRGERYSYPKLCHSGISDKADKDYSDAVKNLIDSGVVMADDELEKFMRNQYKLPEMSIETRRQKQSLQPTQMPLMEKIKALRLSRGQKD
jgi:phage gp29-like protein